VCLKTAPRGATADGPVDGVVEGQMDSTVVGQTGGSAAGPGRGFMINKHSTDVETPPPIIRVCVSGRLLLTWTRPTLELLLCV